MGNSDFWVGSIVPRTGFSLPTVATAASGTDALGSSGMAAIVSATGALTGEGSSVVKCSVGASNTSMTAGVGGASITSGAWSSGAERIAPVVGTSALSAGASVFVTSVAGISAPKVGALYPILRAEEFHDGYFTCTTISLGWGHALYDKATGGELVGFPFGRELIWRWRRVAPVFGLVAPMVVPAALNSGAFSLTMGSRLHCQERAPW